MFSPHVIQIVNGTKHTIVYIPCLTVAYYHPSVVSCIFMALLRREINAALLVPEHLYLPCRKLEKGFL